MADPAPFVALRSDDRALLRELFVEPQTTYKEAEVYRLTRLTPAALEHAIAEVEIEPVMSGGGRLFTWQDVAQLALKRWTPRMVSAAAGAAVPHLNQTRRITVELPLYKIRLLHWLAITSSEPDEPPLNVSDVLDRELEDLASAELPGGQIPGFTEAVHFPSFQRRLRAAADGDCTYCGSPISAQRGACALCAALHEPTPRTEEGG